MLRERVEDLPLGPVRVVESAAKAAGPRVVVVGDADLVIDLHETMDRLPSGDAGEAAAWLHANPAGEAVARAVGLPVRPWGDLGGTLIGAAPRAAVAVETMRDAHARGAAANVYLRAVAGAAVAVGMPTTLEPACWRWR